MSIIKHPAIRAWRSLVHAATSGNRSARSFTADYKLNTASSHLPRVASPSIWRSVVPKFLRRRTSEDQDESDPQIVRRPHWTSNPGFPIIVFSLLAGSFAINIIALRREMVTFERHIDAKLGLLREVIGKVKAGEQVDVKRLMGTGDPETEREWEEFIQELARADPREKLAASRAAQSNRPKDKQAAEEKEIVSAQAAPIPSTDAANKPKFMM